MQTVNDIAQTLNLRATFKPTDSNPQMIGQMPEGSRHYRVEFRRQLAGKLKRLTAYFSMGPGLTHDPEPSEVLSCLAGDALFLECARDFHDWAREAGFDIDDPDVEREARKAYRQVDDARARLANFMGDDFEQLLAADPE